MRILVAAVGPLIALAALAAEPEPAPQQAPPKQAVPAATSAPADRPAAPASRERGTMDRLELDATAITGNRELPKVMYVVPWKRADLGDLAGKPANSLLDEALAPVDRAVFRREVKYFGAVEAAAPAQAETPVTAPVGQP
jgi:hypothetical protein